MRGQNTIIRMRMERLKPAMVWLFVLDRTAPRGFFNDAENVIANGGLAEVHIGADEVAGTLDFRFLTGLTVLLQGVNVERMREVFARLREFDPEKIITSTPDMVHVYEAKNE